MKVPLGKSYKALYEFCHNDIQGDALTCGVGGQRYRVTTKTHAPELDSGIGSTLTVCVWAVQKHLKPPDLIALQIFYASENS